VRRASALLVNTLASASWYAARAAGRTTSAIALATPPLGPAHTLNWQERWACVSVEQCLNKAADNVVELGERALRSALLRQWPWLLVNTLANASWYAASADERTTSAIALATPPLGPAQQIGLARGLGMRVGRTVV
jgi:hypothetical protein